MPKIITCQLCRQQGPSAKSHVLPDGFFRAKKDSRGRISRMHLDNPRQDDFIQSGPWDKSLLCQSCEIKYATLDDYGIRFFRDGDYEFERIRGEFGDALLVKAIDQTLLKKFLHFLAWRIGASTRPDFKNVQLGSGLERLRHLVQSSDATNPQTFPVVLKRNEGSALFGVGAGWNYPISAHEMSMDPCIQENWDGRRVLNISLGDHVVYMAVDDLPAVGLWATCAIGAADFLLIVSKSFAQSPEVRLIREKLREA